MKASSVKRLLGIGALALLLTGCFRVNFDIEVKPENTVAGTAVIAVDEDLLGLTGQSEQQFFDDMDISDLPENATIDEYHEDGFVGRQITFDDVPLDEFAQNGTLSGSGSGEELTIVREGDEFVVDGAFDMSGPEFTGQDIPEQLLENFEFQVTMTFPGPVTSSTGEVDGNTVTWEPQFGEENPIQARASAIPSSSSPLLMIILIAVGALLLGALAYFLTHRSKPVPAEGPMEGAATPVDPSVAAAAPLEAPPPPAGTSPPAPIDAPPAPTQPVPPAAPEPPTEPIPPGDDTAPAAPPAEQEPPEAPDATNTMDTPSGETPSGETPPQDEPPTAPSS